MIYHRDITSCSESMLEDQARNQWVERLVTMKRKSRGIRTAVTGGDSGLPDWTMKDSKGGLIGSIILLIGNSILWL